jgi:hypothetical protein
VLLGGRAQDEVDVAGEFTILLEADREGVVVSFSGVRGPDELRRELGVEELKSRYSEILDVSTDKDRRFFVHLSSGCQ